LTPNLEETITLDFVTSNPATGAAADADSTPTAEVFEDATDTAILTPTVVKRTGKTGNYRLPVACTAANGFEVGKSYNIVASCVFSSVTYKARVGSFQVRPAVPDVNVAQWKGSVVPTPTNAGHPRVDVYYVLGTTATDSSTSAVEIAEAVLVRSTAAVQATMPEFCLGSLVHAGLKWGIAGPTWTVYESDGTTPILTRTITVSGGQITGVT
jgi:hypothetical protein